MDVSVLFTSPRSLLAKTGVGHGLKSLKLPSQGLASSALFHRYTDRAALGFHAYTS
jgi:hypothetical protein